MIRRSASGCARSPQGQEKLQHRDRQPRHRAPHPARARPLGRGAARSASSSSPACSSTATSSTRPSERDDEGGLLRPDLVVKLPGGKTIVVDSKVPLDASSTRSTARTTRSGARTSRGTPRLARAHAQLGQKRYWRQFDPSPEFVVMFLGDEAWFRAALDQDGSLLEAGAESGVVVGLAGDADRAAAQRRLRLAAGDRGRERPQRLASSAASSTSASGSSQSHFAKAGRGLDMAVGAYNQRGRLVRAAPARHRAQVPGARQGGDDLPDMRPFERNPARAHCALPPTRDVRRPSAALVALAAPPRLEPSAPRRGNVPAAPWRLIRTTSSEEEQVVSND